MAKKFVYRWKYARSQMAKTNVSSIVTMYLKIEEKAGSEEAERWLDEQEIELPKSDVQKVERKLAQLHEEEK